MIQIELERKKGNWRYDAGRKEEKIERGKFKLNRKTVGERTDWHRTKRIVGLKLRKWVKVGVDSKGSVFQ